MLRPSWIVVFLLSAWFGGVSVHSAAAAEDFVFYHENVMGTSLELRVRADGVEAARWAETEVLGEIDRQSSIFSGYDRASEFSRWQSEPRKPTRVSPELYEMLEASDHWRAQSGGTFDPRVQVLTELWSRCAKEDRLPDSTELIGVKSLFQEPAWRLDPVARTAERLSACPLSLNAIAKGFIVERACNAALRPAKGVRGLLLNVGGDMRVCGDLVRTIGIISPTADSEASEPFAYIEVQNRAVATSGNSQRGFRIQGQWYSHVFDPRSGRPVAQVASATVVAERSADADALDTILNVLSPEEGIRLVDSLPGVECLIVAADGHVSRSKGWSRYERAKPTALAFAGSQGEKKDAAPSNSAKSDPKADSAASWGKEYELVVNFEINRPDNTKRGYRRPYVAIWIEDEKGFPVRNLVLWVSHGGPGPFQWLPDLKRWYGSDKDRKAIQKTDMVDTISRPTRPPGKYSVIWDGKNDLGKPVPAGEYTLFIESAREHGTYQNIRTPLKIGNAPFAEDLKGNVEIKSAAIEYRRKTRGK